ncbi:N-acetyltransferase 6 (GCN5-related) [Nesidiocoris tenuis]|uniref:N-acetyltransferase 6 (GCN5-related) n=1 Tax=Nesidiocoris tenuis TaxID=355587 RepID=A0ABN7B7V9_9HEMI|nr:N-acetyltransferase 6 (GCN5-related) [Nesidiocoris tenuis]
MEFEFLQVMAMHECKHLIMEACNLINSEWPRSKTARLQSLFMSCDKFPTSLVLILNDFQIVGHVKLSEITVGGPDIILESVIIHKEHRGKGWGKMLMEDAEDYVRRRGKKMIYLSTRGQEGFYEKLGYEVCKPLLYYGVALEPTPDHEPKVNGHENLSENGAVQNVDVRNGEVKNGDVGNAPPPPPPPPPISRTIFRDIQTSKTYMCKPA